MENINEEMMNENSTEEVLEDKANEEQVNDKETVEAEETQECDFEKLKNDFDELTDSYARLQAEYANYRRRTNEEKDTIGLFANEKLITEMLGVIDNMERALESFEDTSDPRYEGVNLVYKGLKDTLGKFGMEEISSEIGEDFDPNFHMAVMQEAVEGMEAGKVAMVLQKGYKLGNKVLRASMVKVSN